MNEPGPSASNQAQPPDLGAEVVRCRGLSGAQTLTAQGYVFGWGVYYVLYPLVMLPGIVLGTIFLPLGLLAQLLGHQFETVLDAIGLPILASAFLLLYGVICWLAFIWPRADYFVLHEKGLRIRAGFKRVMSSLESIHGVFVGRAHSKAEAGLRSVINVLKPSEAEWLNQLDNTAVSVVLADGTTHVFKGILTRFEPSDLELLFHELIKRNPRLGMSVRIGLTSAEKSNP